jgi:thioredoxin-related protein
MSPFKYFYLLVLVSLISCQNDSQHRSATQFDPGRDPYHDLKEAIREAQETNKNILLDVGGEWCIWCKKLDKFYDENPDVKKFLHQNYVVVKVNYSPENKNETFLLQYPKISGYPHLFVLDQNGKLIHSQETGSLESGPQHDRDKVYAFLKRYASKRE